MFFAKFRSFLWNLISVKLWKVKRSDQTDCGLNRYMNVLQHTRNERNPCLKQNRPDRSYRDTLLRLISFLSAVSYPWVFSLPVCMTMCENYREKLHVNYFWEFKGWYHFSLLSPTHSFQCKLWELHVKSNGIFVTLPLNNALIL